ncbi:uncharacterized protein LOC117643464 [Thrips palmi]|uniref:Uncharacterized protein LOC117643464 n=1 Tax=Thrips palmi TaxID=161013 RepID=A0A6P8YN59_THRPL|nr:uncharacterized protein LOC117643464 [Thrips palmi]
MDGIVDALQLWRELLIPVRKQPGNRHSYYWRWVVGSRLMLTLCSTMGALILGAALHADTVDEMSRGVRMEFAFLLIIPTTTFFMSRRQLLDKELSELQQVAQLLAAHSHNNKESLKKACSWTEYLLRYSKVYAMADTFTLIIPLIMSQERMEVPMWPWPPGKVWVLIGSLSQVCLGTPFAVHCFLSMSLYTSVIMIIVSLYQVLASTTLAADTPAKWKEVAMLDSKMSKVGMAVRDSLSLLSTFSLILLLTPLGSSLMALKGKFDLFTAVSIPYTMLYVAMCTMGHNLKDASDRVAASAYNGQWVELRDQASHTYVLTIMSRRARPHAVFARFGMGMVDLVTCLEVLRSWYSLLQLVAKVF